MKAGSGQTITTGKYSFFRKLCFRDVWVGVDHVEGVELIEEQEGGTDSCGEDENIFKLHFCEVFYIKLEKFDIIYLV